MVFLYRSNILILLILVCMSPAVSYGAENIGRDYVAALPTSQAQQQSVRRLEGALHQLLDAPLTKALELRIPIREEYRAAQDQSERQALLKWFFPGENSLHRMTTDLDTFASPPRSSFGHEQGLLDDSSVMSSAGRMVTEPVNLFNDFEIRVSRATYKLELCGMKSGREPKVLFTCRTGLGSSEFPTPTGSYFVVTIFDDHPLWIPPKDREWALGMTPSNRVYGGHMMPFFKKAKRDKGNPDDVITEDIIVPELEFADTGTYRIHGTDSPWSVGSSQSHGCVRLLNKSVKGLSDTLKMYVGTTTRGNTENGSFITLARPVKLKLF